MPTKKNPEMNVEQATKEEQKKPYGAAHKILLIYLGIFTSTFDEIDKLTHRLIERGEIAEHDSRRLLHDMMDQRMQKTHQGEDGKYSQTKSFNKREPLASKTDIEILNEQITRISAEFDKFSEEADINLLEPPG